MIKILTTVIVLFIFTASQAQVPYVVDECLLSEPSQIDFPSGFDLANNGSDLLQWTGTTWTGAWANAYITIPPPSQLIGCRAVFIGSGVFWTAPGEAFAMRLSSPLRFGTSYSFMFTYVSHGWGSDGAFSPILSSGNMPVFGNDKYVMNLPPAGYNWENHIVTFTASEQQDGDIWLFLKTDENVSSGMISSFCKDCSTIATAVTNVDVLDVTIYPNPASGFLQINGLLKDAQIKIYTISGAELTTEVLSDYNNKEYRMDISSLDPGCYFLKISNGDHVVTRKFIKK